MAGYPFAIHSISQEKDQDQENHQDQEKHQEQKCYTTINMLSINTEIQIPRLESRPEERNQDLKRYKENKTKEEKLQNQGG